MAARLLRPHCHGAAVGQFFFIYNCKFLFQYSTIADKTACDQTHFLVNYLVNSLGFSRGEAISTSTKVTRSKSTGNPQSVLKFLEKSGLDKTHIGNIVSAVPKLLVCDVDKTLKPKLDILQGIGLTGSDLVKVITGSVSILKSLEVSDLEFCISYLRKILGSDEYVVKAIKKRTCLLSVKACERVKINMLFFQSIGFTDDDIKKFILQNPYTLLASPEVVEEKVHRLENEFHISRASGLFIHGVDVFISMKESTVDTKLDVLRDYGWSKWEIIKLVQLLPYCLRLSKEKLRAALDFYMVQLGLKPAYLASHPTLLMFSMKKRVLPRLEFMRSLVEKKLCDEDYNLYTVLLPSEQKFYQAYVLAHKMPDVCELYNKIQQHGKDKKQLPMLCWMRHARMTTVVAFNQRRAVMATALQMTHCCLMRGLDLQLVVISSMHSYRLPVANTQHSVKQAEAEPVMHNFTSFNSLRWINFNVNSSQAGQIAMAEFQLGSRSHRKRDTEGCVRYEAAAAAAAARFHGFTDFLSLNSIKSQCLYSTSATSALVKYLVDSLGFSKQEASSASSKVTSRKHLDNPDLVINFLKQTGFRNTQVKKLVFMAPKLLYHDVNKTLKPKFQCLMDLGLSGSDLAKLTTKDTTIVEKGLVTHLRPTIDFLRKILGSDEDVVKAIKKSSWLISFNAHQIMKNNVVLLRNSGVSDVKIRKVVLICPHYLTQKPEWVKDLLHRLEKDFRIPLHSPMFPYGFHALAAQKKSKYENKIEIFKSFGWSNDYVLMMFRKLPYCIALSEDKIQKALSFYMNRLGCEPAYLASHPSILVFSLEKRVVPRMQVLKILDEKKIERRKLGFYYALTITETKFMDYFVLPYKDQIPDLYEQLNKIVAP
ncbi:uncharacterized protein LOC107017007 [Solanum pennellii]|uniref:Uncharacterized protein LOC107017007 n=1 Tax=Solanum pennellii TaxID=28526 RepID=A0ABM1V9K0_SOLPN|nr:uncharacterized protein LOC107017007 [Solanum pennellii]